MKRFKSHIKEAKDTYCSDECCGADVKAEDCDCSADCPHCNCNAIDEAGCSSSKKTVKEAGLWDNIHAKRKRIKNGSGEKMKKPGSKGAPTDQDFKDASESVELDEMSPADKKRISQMYDKKGNLTPLGKKVMDHGKKAADAKVADKARRKEYNAYQKSKRNEEAELEEAPKPIKLRGFGPDHKKASGSSLKKIAGMKEAELEEAPKPIKLRGFGPDHKKASGSSLKKIAGMKEAKRRFGKTGAPKMTGDSIAIQRAKDAEHNAAMGRTKTGRKKPVRTMTSTQRSLAQLRGEAVELDESNINQLCADYINENNIDPAIIENMTEEELNEFIGKAIGGAVKLGAKAVIGTGRLAGRGVKRAVTTKQGSFRGTQAAKQDKAGDRAEKMAKKREAEAKRAERIRNAQDRSDAADARLSDLKKNKKNK